MELEKILGNDGRIRDGKKVNMHDASVPTQWLKVDEVSGQLVKAAAEWGNRFWTSTNE